MFVPNSIDWKSGMYTFYDITPRNFINIIYVTPLNSYCSPDQMQVVPNVEE